MLNTPQPHDEPKLHPAVISALNELGLHQPAYGTEGVSNYTPHLPMLACIKATQELARSLADGLRSDFWDGGDDIDYTRAAGDMIQRLTNALSSDLDDDACTTLLNRIAHLDAAAIDRAGSSDYDPHNPVTDDDIDLFGDVTGCGGGYSSPTLDAVLDSLLDKGSSHNAPHQSGLNTKEAN